MAHFHVECTIETRRLHGVVVWDQGKRKDFKPPRVIETKNTIGAGDTFFAAFISHYLLEHSVSVATTKALDYTCDFLWIKNRVTTKN